MLMDAFKCDLRTAGFISASILTRLSENTITMKTMALFFWALVLVGIECQSQPAPQFFEHEITAKILTWKKVAPKDFPAYQSRAYKRWLRDFAQSGDTHFSEVDLNADGRMELIVADNDFPACGRAFLVMQFQAGNWTNVAEFRGGFVLVRPDVRKYFSLQILDKCLGEMRFYELGYRDGKYHTRFSTTLSHTLYDSQLYEKWKSLNRLTEDH